MKTKLKFLTKCLRNYFSKLKIKLQKQLKVGTISVKKQLSFIMNFMLKLILKSIV